MYILLSVNTSWVSGLCHKVNSYLKIVQPRLPGNTIKNNNTGTEWQYLCIKIDVLN